MDNQVFFHLSDIKMFLNDKIIFNDSQIDE